MRSIGIRRFGLRFAKRLGLAAALAAAVPLFVRPTETTGAPSIDPSCESGAAPSTFTGSALDTATPEKDGVTYDDTVASLSLSRAAGLFRSTNIGISDLVALACAADFNNDGWTDFMGLGDTTFFLRMYKNETYLNPEPDWNDPNQVRTPRFTPMSDLAGPSSSSSTRGAIACGDFNADGNADFVYARCINPGGSNDTCVPTEARLYRGNGNGTFQSSYQFVSSLSTLQRLTWGSGNIAVTDYNGDGRQDLIWGAGTNSTSNSTMTTRGGDVLILLNNGATPPMFTYAGDLLSDAGYNLRGPVALAMADVTGDTVKDLLVAGPSTNRLRVHPGLLGGGVSATPQSLTFGTGAAAQGGGTLILTADFSLDGRIDFFVGSDNFNWTTTNGTSTSNHIGANGYLYVNDGDPQPFSGGMTQQLSFHQDPHSAGALFDFDNGFVMDYDHDPDNTPDFSASDGNHSGTYFMFANRVVPQYVECGTVASGVLDIGSLSTEEMTVTSVRLEPTVTLNGGTITWEASNNNGTTWHAMSPCADDPNDQCVTFSSAVGNQIRWRATMCSNPAHTATPRISGVGVSFIYVVAANHFRAGPVARDGLIYVGAFRQPGDAGHFFAISDETGDVVWDAAALLETNSARTIYTAAADNTRLAFSTSSAGSTQFQQTLLAPDSTTAAAIVDWQRSSRFGLTSPQVLGGVESSTPAVLTPPTRPMWYTDNDTTTAERTAIDAYVVAYANRQELVFVGSKDGALHAFYTDSFDATDANNGREAWAFIPYDVAQRLNADRVAGTATAYPDGPPTLADAKINGAWRTVLISGEGNGGRHIYALDVTQTIDPSSGGIIGPTPLWSFSDANMGRSYSKPAVIRVKVAGVERWFAVFASGPGLVTDVGDSVYAVDLATGALVWHFNLNDSNVYISTDISAFETDDENGTAIDGFVDRIVFGDSKGRIWKLDPAAYSGTTIVPVGSSVDVGLAYPALWSTRLSDAGLGEDRAISAAIAVGDDPITGRTALYFGTGGTEESPNNVQNGFFSVAADDGATLNVKLGPIGTKFHSGMLNDGQIILSQGQDLSGLGLCSPTAGDIVAIDQGTFAEQFSIPVGAKISGPVYVTRGAFYTVNVKGKLVKSAYTGPPTSYGPTPPPPGQGGGSGPGQTVTDFTVLGWRHVR